nr:substrate-binding domain-containing protein [Dictyoglomus thermophilum]
MGFDDISLASLLRPSLTTIRQDKDKMAQKLIEVLIDKIEGKNAESKYILPISLIERESTNIK